MSISDRLPREIQIKIFNYLRIVDLLECQLTCKRWNECSARALYKNIEFHSFSLKRASEFMKALIRRRYLKAYIQHIKVTCYDNYVEQSRDLLIFFANECPNVRTVTLYGKINAFYPNNLDHEKWKFLEKFHTHDSDQPNLAIGIAKQHQGTIKEIELIESDIPILCDNKQDIKEKLAEFRSLEKISITIKHSRHLSSFDNMIPKNIKSLTLVSDSFRNEQNTTDPQYIDLREITPCPNIKELILRIPLNNENSFKYLMHKFPKLETLSYKSRKIISVSKNTREAFTNYLLGIKNINVMYTLVCNSDSPMDYFFIKKLIESSKTKDSKKKRDFIVIINAYTTDIDAVYVCKKTNNGLESYKISLSLEELQNLDFLKSFGTDVTGLDVGKTKGDGLSFRKILMLCPNLKSLELSGFYDTLDEQIKGNTTNHEALEYLGSPEILSEWPKHFPNLTDLIFLGSANIAVDLSSIITAFPNLVSLEMNGVEVLLSNTDKKSYTVKKLGLNNCKLPSNGFFSDLSSYLPNVCELELCINAKDLKYSTLILDMPETSLQGLSISVYPSYHRQPPSLFKISLSVGDIETDSNKRYYLGADCLRNKTKKCTKAEYESVAEDSNVFEIFVNCKELPIIVNFFDCPPNLLFEAGTLHTNTFML